jgi:hypothetical protein
MFSSVPAYTLHEGNILHKTKTKEGWVTSKIKLLSLNMILKGGETKQRKERKTKRKK